MDTLHAWLSELAGEEWLQLGLLFAATFVLEEGALIAAAGLAAAGELSPLAAAAAVFGGIVVSDWVLYWMGHLGARVPWFRRRVGEATLDRGRRYLAGELVLALLAARLVPWLLFPIFISCGFLGVGFRRFVLLNFAIAAVYTALLFGGTLLLGELVFAYLENWGWLVLGTLALAVGLAHYAFARRRR